MNIPMLPESAPFSELQRGWLNGYLAGILSGGSLSKVQAPATTTEDSTAPTKSVCILYASQSGNAEALAYSLEARLKGARASETDVWKPRIAAMDQFSQIDWSQESHLLAVTSTWGDGEFPDNGKPFWNWLQTEQAKSLAHLKVAVLGIGDRNYARFCAAGALLQQKLLELGCTALREPELLDTDHEGPAAQWRESIATLLGASASPEAAATATANSAQATWSKTRPFPAPLVENRRLNSRQSAKDTRHIAVSLAGSGLTYRAGDALGVWPVNHFELVDSLVLACNANGNETVTAPDGQELSFRAALLSRYDLNKPAASLLNAILEAMPAQGDRRRLLHLLSDEGASEKEELLRNSDVLDLLRTFPTARIEATTLCQHLRKLAPRLYSISSSPLAHPNEVHLTVGVQQVERHGRKRLGAASSFLASRVPLGLPVSIFVQPSSHFHPPEDPSRDLIMVGPGTGIAPFRAFLQERAATQGTGRNWLFFGDQFQEHDFLYREEILEWRGKGVLHELDLAFSRDQEEKIYVQTRMLERAAELWKWLENGATFCVCGDAKRMARDVDNALRRVIEIGGNKTPEEASAWLETLRAEKRYLRDVY